MLRTVGSPPRALREAEMNQRFVAKLCKIIALAMSRSICTATCTATGANPTNQPAEQVYKNIQMLFAIDNQNFDSGKKVTCYTCHRGSTKPLAIPPVATDWSKLDVPAS